MQTKVFEFINFDGIDIEREINEWLAENRVVIRFITQSEVLLDASYNTGLTASYDISDNVMSIIVWYEVV